MIIDYIIFVIFKRESCQLMVAYCRRYAVLFGVMLFMHLPVINAAPLDPGLIFKPETETFVDRFRFAWLA